MANMLPSKNELLDFGKYAVGGVVEEMVSNWAKQKITVEFIQKYPILIDVGMFFVGYMLSKVKGLKEVGRGFAITATASIVSGIFDLVAGLTGNQ